MVGLDVGRALVSHFLVFMNIFKKKTDLSCASSKRADCRKVGSENFGARR